MKKQKILIRIVCLLCMLSFSSCGLFEGVEREQTISGHIYIDCDMQPLKNYTIQFYGGGGGGGGGRGEVLFTTTTDENGYFYANFKNKYPELSIWDPQNFGFTLFDLDPTENLIDHDFIIFETGRLQIKVQTTQSYTDQDTLYFVYTASGFESRKIIGPFENNTVVFEEDLDTEYLSYSEYRNIIWGIGHQEHVDALNAWYRNLMGENYQPYNFASFELGGCGTVNEVTIPLP